MIFRFFIILTFLSFAVGNHLRCDFAPGLTVGNRTTELECCKNAARQFYRSWHSGRYYLSTFLGQLQTWNCPQFKQECERRTFNYTDFTSLVYLRFCNRSQMEKQCYDDIQNIVSKQHKGIEITSTFDELVSKLDLNILSMEELLHPCVQIGMFDIDSGGHGHYHEVIEPIIPFCSFIWCGFDESVVDSRDISAWTCMPNSCRASILVVMVVAAILAVAACVCNATILCVLFSNTNLQNGQAIYRLSLAFADILVGAIVFPTFISSLQKYFIMPHELGKLKNITGYEIANSSSFSLNLTTVELRGSSGLFRDRFTLEYLNAVGFFTVISLSVSIYTLVAASIDRFMAVFRPLKYNQTKAISAARIIVVTIWSCGLILALLPLDIHSLRYVLVSSILVSSGGKSALILYLVAFIIPLLLMWGFTIGTFYGARKASSEWATSQRSDGQQSQAAIEMRLVRTLGIMVGVFTLCLLPVALVVLVSLFLPQTLLADPLNLDPKATGKFISAEVVVVLLLASNSLWNCFIYSARDSNFRQASKSLYFHIVQALRLDLAWNVIVRCDGMSEQRRTSERIRQDSVVSATEATTVLYKNDQLSFPYNATTAN